MIHTFTIVISAGVLLFWIVNAIAMGRGMRRMAVLKKCPRWPTRKPQPRVTVIIPARNEERHIAAALRSVLAQDYNNYEVLVLNDRSTDNTGAILDSLAAAEPRLRVEHVRELPRGWLGKNHVMAIGAARASGDWLLFTDADVVMEPDTLSRAMALAAKRRLDHLTLTPELIGGTWWLKTAVGAFTIFFAMAVRPWHVRNPRRREFVGIGAFNLVRREAYRTSGGHRRIRLRPDDDVRLGQILKRSGSRQDIAFGTGQLRVEWYQTLGEFVRGLEKNVFAGFNYSAAMVLAASAMILMVAVWPFVALFLMSGLALGLSMAAALIIWLILSVKALTQRENLLALLAFPIGALILVYVICRSTALALWRGGIPWRGTFYNLRLLKKNTV